METEGFVTANQAKLLIPIRSKIYDFVDSQLTLAVVEGKPGVPTMLTSDWIIGLAQKIEAEYKVRYSFSGMYSLVLRRNKAIGAQIMFTKTIQLRPVAKSRSNGEPLGPICGALQLAFEKFLAEHVQPIEKKMQRLETELSDAKELLRVLTPLRKAAEDASKVIGKHNGK